jgi:type III secretion protein U
MSEEKTLPPTERHLNKLAEKGQAPHSRMVRTFLGLVVTAAIVAALAGFVADRLMLNMTGAVAAARAPSLAAVQASLLGAAADLLGSVAMILGAAAVAIIIIAVVEGGHLRFVPDALSPKFERFNPIQGIGRLFKLRNLVETLQGILASGLWLGTAAILLQAAIGPILVAPLCGLGCVAASASSIGERLLLAFFCIFGLFALVDLRISRAVFRHENRMSKQQVKDEQKDSNGNPEVQREVSSSRRELMHAPSRSEIARNACLALVRNKRAIVVSFDPVLRHPPVVAWRGSAADLEGYLAGIGRPGLPCFGDRASFRSLKNAPIGVFIPEEAYPHVIPVLFAAGKL